MRFHVEGWDPGYGAALASEALGELTDGGLGEGGLGEGGLGESSARVEVGVEVPAEAWRPVAPSASASLPDALLFVDGVRRIDANVWIDEPVADGSPAVSASQGLCASYGAGAVLCGGGRAEVLLHEVRRGLFTVAPHAHDLVTGAGVYRARHVAPGGATPV